MSLSVSHCVRAVALSALVAGLPFPAAADEIADQVAALKQELATSLKEIQALSARLQALEAGAAAKPEAAAAPSTARIETLEQELGQLRDSVSRGSQDSGVPLHGFADVGWNQASKSAKTGQMGGANVGTLDFYLTPQLGDRVRTLFEIAMEYDHAAGQMGVDVERGQIGYVVNDGLTVWGGRFHTPYGYWNTAFHHGAQIQTALSRPTFVDFEDRGGVLPAHTVGLWATGGTGLGSGRMLYDAYVANGSRIANGQIDFNALHDDNGNKAVGGRLSYQFGGALDGLVAGLHGLTEEVDVYGSLAYQNLIDNPANLNAASARTRLKMLGGYAFYDANDWEVIGEYYHFNNEDLSAAGGSHGSSAGFLQIGKALTAHWMPYARFEKASFDQTDPYFANLTLGGQSYQRSVVGIRYNINPKSALKLEINHTRQTDSPLQDYSAVRAQYSVRF